MSTPTISSTQLEVLERLSQTPQSAQSITSALFRDELLPGESTSFVERIHGRLKTMTRNGLVERHAGRPATWSISERGQVLLTR